MLKLWLNSTKIRWLSVDDNDELTGRFGVRNIPTVLFIKDGKVQDKTVGAVTKAELEEKLKALL